MCGVQNPLPDQSWIKNYVNIQVQIYWEGCKISLKVQYAMSLTCILSKMLESIVHSQLCDHVQSSGTLSDCQYGFRRNHSCCYLLVSTIDDWLLARDRNLSTAIVYLDLRKAFDNVRHQNLLQCLQNAGIGGTVLRWIHHFLTDRYYQLIIVFERFWPGHDSSNSFQHTSL